MILSRTVTQNLQPLCVAAVCCGSCILPTNVLAAPPHLERAGQVIANVGSTTVSLPLLKSNYDVSIEGSQATVTLKQTFLNNGTQPLNATYLFPLNQKAAVYSMKMKMGDEIIQAMIQRKEEAKKTFETAKHQGKTASLLEQHRPNMFTQNIANLMPQMPVTVTLKYVQTVPKKDNAYELVVPMVVGPRYEGGLPKQVSKALELESEVSPEEVQYQSEVKTEKVAGWTIEKLPAYPKVIGWDAPANIDPKHVSFNLKLESANPISNVNSRTHKLDVQASKFNATASLSQTRTIDNRDMILRYELGSDGETTAGVLSHYDKRGGFVALEIEPPKIPVESDVTPREIVFVLDTSGSMRGMPLNASKTFMRTALKNLRPTDHFRVLRFSNNTSQFAKSAMPATQSNISAGVRFVNGLSASGGTQMNNAINAAFDLPPLDNTLRIVVFLTDGYIGTDRQVIQTVSNRIGNSRIYAFGVGRSVNRYLLEGLAKEGRGKARYVELGESATEVAETLASQLEAPLLTDISIDWNGLEIKEQTPSRISDLFAGQSLRVMARYKNGGKHEVTLKGFVNGRSASIPINLDLPEKPSSKESALPLIWAREQVFDLERDYTISGGKNKQKREAITRLGLDYSLQTAFTSFVAVSKKVYNETPSATKTTAVALPQVSGVSKSAYPKLNLSGSSTPEPETIFGFMIAFFLLFIRFRKRVFSNLSRPLR